MVGTINTLKQQDKVLCCIDCGVDFIFTVGEQRYFASKGLSIPKRCPECRSIRKATICPDLEAWSNSSPEIVKCDTCYHQLAGGYCACRELVDVGAGCSDWSPREGQHGQ